MPLLGAMHLLLAIGFAVHAMKTGRPQYWLWILLTVPLLGTIAYVLIELLPELARTRAARKVGSDIRTIMDPDHELRTRLEQARMTDSVETKRKLAEAYEGKGMWDEAINLYREATVAQHEDDPALLIGLARAQLGAEHGADAQGTLDRLRAAHPDFQSQEAHLIYARALEQQGRIDDAFGEYRALVGYYAGFEARTRFGLALLRRGEPGKAREMFESIVTAAKARPAWMTEGDRDWLKVARANLQ